MDDVELHQLKNTLIGSAIEIKNMDQYDVVLKYLAQEYPNYPAKLPKKEVEWVLTRDHEPIALFCFDSGLCWGEIYMESEQSQKRIKPFRHFAPLFDNAVKYVEEDMPYSPFKYYHVSLPSGSFVSGLITKPRLTISGVVSKQKGDMRTLLNYLTKKHETNELIFTPVLWDDIILVLKDYKVERIETEDGEKAYHVRATWDPEKHQTA